MQLLSIPLICHILCYQMPSTMAGTLHIRISLNIHTKIFIHIKKNSIAPIYSQHMPSYNILYVHINPLPAKLTQGAHTLWLFPILVQKQYEIRKGIVVVPLRQHANTTFHLRYLHCHRKCQCCRMYFDNGT